MFLTKRSQIRRDTRRTTIPTQVSGVVRPEIERRGESRVVDKEFIVRKVSLCRDNLPLSKELNPGIRFGPPTLSL